ncbi:MAG: protoporphyrinogen oxidase [Acidobacteriia bacterium]|nr:protoporphyrinogen oxidase [Terriglobia bacterium]
MTTSHAAVVVGGGISGLSCAFALRRAGLDAILLESASRPGGVIRSERRDGWLFEHGPQSFTATSALLEMIREIGLESEVARADSRAPRFVLVNGALVPVPLSPPAFFASSLLGWKTKFSLLGDLFSSSRPPEPDESLADFIRRKFTPELLEKLAGPFVSGIYAGDPERLSLRSAFPMLHAAEAAKGSLVRGMFAVAKVEKAARPQKGPREKSALISFRGGNDALPQALGRHLGDALWLNSALRQIEHTPLSPQRFSLRVLRGDREETILCDHLILATPPDRAGELLANLDPQFAQHLGAIEFASIAVVSLGYQTSQIARAMTGFGFLVPRSAGLRLLGSVWNSSLFPGRAPEGSVLFANFMGGASDPAIAKLDPNALIEIAQRELSPILGIQGPPVFSEVRIYPRAIPQYNLGHSTRLAAINALRAKFPGLWMAGSYWKGPAVYSCAEYGLETAAAVIAAANQNATPANS